MTKPAFQVEGVRKRHGDDFDLSIDELFIERGTVCSILGDNGAGKTTLLKILAGLTLPDQGEIRFHGRQMLPGGAGLSTRRRMVYLSQRPRLLRGTVLRNVLFGLSARGISGTAAIKLAEEALDDVGMASYSSRKANALSGGEAQRIALARALCLDVDALLLDEPTSHVDEDFTQGFETCLKKLQDDRGTTILIATHDSDLADRLAQQKVYLARGRLIQVLPTPEERRARMAGEPSA
ncbi:MAG: ABC transporter ATP-binding protein [Planctomycetota bacterium]|jgi:ABC-type multidrug transport system ATPase subunit|nr:ABC transporter ATP-binding protein [Planctomycetota bacterium]